jgi:hypothetical protein
MKSIRKIAIVVAVGALFVGGAAVAKETVLIGSFTGIACGNNYAFNYFSSHSPKKDFKLRRFLIDNPLRCQMQNSSLGKYIGQCGGCAVFKNRQALVYDMSGKSNSQLAKKKKGTHVFVQFTVNLASGPWVLGMVSQLQFLRNLHLVEKADVPLDLVPHHH